MLVLQSTTLAATLGGSITQNARYAMETDGCVFFFRNADGSMATEEELRDEARRHSASWAADTRFCHVFNHSHECKPTCFKNTEYNKPSADEAPEATSRVPISLLDSGTHSRTMVATHGQITFANTNSCCNR